MATCARTPPPPRNSLGRLLGAFVVYRGGFTLNMSPKQAFDSTVQIDRFASFVLN